MPLRFILAGAMLLLISGAPVRAADPVWIQVSSPNFTLFTDTTEVKGRRLLTDFESRVAAIGEVLGEIPKRQFPVEVFLFARKEQFLEAAPRPTSPGGPPEFEKAAYLWRGPDRVFVAALDKSPSNVADDVGHALGHVFFERTVRWRPFWLAEAVAEQFRNVGRKLNTKRFNEKEGYPVSDILEIVPSREYDDDAPASPFRIQSHQLLHVILSQHRSAIAPFLKALRSEEGQEAKLDVEVETLQSEFNSITETTITAPPVSIDVRAGPISDEAMAIHRGDLFLAAGNRAEAAAWFKGDSENARAARSILTRFSGNTSDAVRVLARAAADSPMLGLVQLHFGSLETTEPADIEKQAGALDRAIALLPLSGRAHAQLARVQTLQGKAEMALAEIDRALALEPEYADEYFLIQAEAFLSLHQYGEANAAARTAAVLPHSERGKDRDYDFKSAEMIRRVDQVRREVEGRRLQQLREEVGALVARREPPPPPPPPPPPEKFGQVEYSLQANRPITIVDSPLPIYSNVLIQKGAVGNITVRVAVGADGKVTQATIVDSRLPEMNDATINVVKKWTFRLPSATAMDVRITFRFSLQ